MYLTYAEYTSYGGTADVTTFTRYEFKVRKILDGVTANRIAEHMTTISEAVKRCMYDLVNLEQIYDDNVKNMTAGGIGATKGMLLSSFTTDGYTETYATGSSNVGEYLLVLRKTTDEAQTKTIRDYLAYEYDDNHVPLLYRGVFR